MPQRGEQERISSARTGLAEVLSRGVWQVNATDGRFDEAADHFAKAMEVGSLARDEWSSVR